MKTLEEEDGFPYFEELLLVRNSILLLYFLTLLWENDFLDFFSNERGIKCVKNVKELLLVRKKPY